MKGHKKSLVEAVTTVDETNFEIRYIKISYTLARKPENKTGRQGRDYRPPLPIHLSKDHRKSQAADFRRL